MFQKGNKLYSVLFFKCPRCHEGDLYPASMLKAPFQMHDSCPHCHQPYMLEPGFYWGAMYIAYALNSGLLLSSFPVLFFLLGLSLNQSLATLLIIAIGFWIYTYRLARAIWINIFVKYEG